MLLKSFIIAVIIFIFMILMTNEKFCDIIWLIIMIAIALGMLTLLVYIMMIVFTGIG